MSFSRKAKRQEGEEDYDDVSALRKDRLSIHNKLLKWWKGKAEFSVIAASAPLLGESGSSLAE
jgi:hypothetical protein